MPKISVRELIEWFNTTTDKTIPYRNHQMIDAIKEAALLQDKSSLEQLSGAMVDAYLRLNPDKPQETMIKNARETLATLAYFADHGSFTEFLALGPVKAYEQPHQYGDTMRLVKSIYDEKQIDLMRDVYQDDISDPALN